MMAIRCEKDSDLWKAVEAVRDARLRNSSDFSLSPPDPGILAVAEYGPLWEAVSKRCRELVPMSEASSRSPGMYHADGRGCSAILERYDRDGTSTVWQVEAHTVPAGLGINVLVHGPWHDNHDAEWEQRVASDRSCVLVVDHRWYTIGDESTKVGTSRESRGFGGRRFVFRMLDDGREVRSTNMWFGGPVPPSWRDRLPDTAVMLEGFHPDGGGDI